MMGALASPGQEPLVEVLNEMVPLDINQMYIGTGTTDGSTALDNLAVRRINIYIVPHPKPATPGHDQSTEFLSNC